MTPEEFLERYPRFGGDLQAARSEVLLLAYQQGVDAGRGGGPTAAAGDGAGTSEAARLLLAEAMAAGVVDREACRVAWARGEAAGRAQAPRRRTPLDDLKLLRYDTLFPLGRWLADRPWQHRAVQAILFFALFPMAILAASGRRVALDDVAWALGFYFALAWGSALYFLMRPPRLLLLRWTLVAVFTIAVGIPLLLLIQEFPLVRLFYLGTEVTNPLARLIGFFGAVAPLEELTKALPVLWLALKLRSLRSPRETAFVGAVSGLAFGVAEAVHYSIAYATLNQARVLQGGDYLLIQAIRWISLPLLHGLWASIAGYYIGLAALVPGRAVALCIVGLLVPTLLHGAYNFFSPGWGSVVVFAVSILLWVSYARSADDISQALTADAADAAPAPLTAR